MKKNPVVLAVFLTYIIFTFSSYAYAAMSDREFLHLCTTSGTAQEVERAIKDGANVHARSSDGFTALMAAALSNPRADVISVLLQNGLDVNHQSEKGQTALIAAVTYNLNPEVAYVLLNNGADVNIKDESGWTALLAAAWRNPYPEIISELLRYGADANATIGKIRAIDYARVNTSLRNTQAYQELKKATNFFYLYRDRMITLGVGLGGITLFLCAKKMESLKRKKQGAFDEGL